jgi:uncharacterized membrane protein
VIEAPVRIGAVSRERLLRMQLYPCTGQIQSHTKVGGLGRVASRYQGLEERAAPAPQCAMPKHLSETSAPQRLTAGLLAGLATTAVPLPTVWQFRGLLGWCVGVAIYLGLAWWLCVRFDAKRTRERAQAQDEPSVVLFLLMLLATMACVAAITVMMQQSRSLTGVERTLHIALAVAALAASWLFIQTIFAFRYAHRYYFEEKQKEPDGPGLQFPGGLDPDYFDFLYYAHVVGMTSQVSDVQVTSREMRRLTLIHSVLSFGFNMLILALSINVVAGSLQ